MLEKIIHSLDTTTLLIVAIFFLLLEYRPPWWYRKQNQDKKTVTDIPGPISLPFLGTTWIFLNRNFNFNKLHEYYQNLHGRYGPIAKEEAFCNVPVINLFEKRDIVKVLKSGGKYPLRPPAEALSQYRKSRPDRYASVGLINEQGEPWFHLRSSLTPALTRPNTIYGFIPQVNEIADDWCNLVRHLRNTDNNIFHLEDVIDRLGLEITCALVLGRRMGFLLPGGASENATKLALAVRNHFVGTRDTYFGLPFWKYVNTPSYKKLIESEELIYDLAVDLIKSADDSTKDSVIFQSVLRANIDEREKTAAIVDFIAAGIHTMKNSFLFFLHLLGQDTVSQSKILNDPTKAYLKACLTESFRLYPTANSLARIIEEEMELSGYYLKPGTVVVCHTGIACRDERNFKQANEFRPERWLGEEKSQTMNNALFLLTPFGAGRRICPGKRLIEQILPILIQYTIENFEVKSEPDLKIQFEFLLTPKTPVSMNFSDRIC